MVALVVSLVALKRHASHRSDATPSLPSSAPRPQKTGLDGGGRDPVAVEAQRHPVVEFDPGDGGRGEVLGVLDDHLSNFRATLDLARRSAPRVNGLTPGAAGAGLCGGGWAGPHRPTVTSTLRHVPAYRHGGGSSRWCGGAGPGLT